MQSDWPALQRFVLSSGTWIHSSASGSYRSPQLSSSECPFEPPITYSWPCQRSHTVLQQCYVGLLHYFLWSTAKILGWKKWKFYHKNSHLESSPRSSHGCNEAPAVLFGVVTLHSPQTLLSVVASCRPQRSSLQWCSMLHPVLYNWKYVLIFQPAATSLPFRAAVPRPERA